MSTELRPAAYVDREASAPYTARLGEAAHRVVPGPPRVTALVAARILNGEGGASASPAWLVMADGRVVATGTGPPPADAIDLGDALLAPGLRRHPGERRGHRRLRARVGRRDRRHDRRAASPAAAPRACRRSAARPSTRTPPMLERLAEVRAARPDVGARRAPRRPVPRRRARRASARVRASRRPRLAHRPVRPLRRPRAARDPRARSRPRSRGRSRCCTTAASSSRSATAPSSYDGAARRGRRGRTDRHASLQRHGPAAPPRPGLAGAALDDRAPDAVDHRRRRARAPGDGCGSRSHARPDAVLVTDAVATVAPVVRARRRRVSPRRHARRLDPHDGSTRCSDVAALGVPAAGRGPVRDGQRGQGDRRRRNTAVSRPVPRRSARARSGHPRVRRSGSAVTSGRA